MNPVLPSKFDITKLTFEPLKAVKAKEGTKGTDKKQIYMKYAGDTLRLQTPIATSPFGISKPYGDEKGEKEWIIDMDLDAISTSGVDGAKNLPEVDVLQNKLKEFKNVLKQIDDKCCEHISNNYKEIWPSKPKAKSKEDIRDDNVYEPLVKTNKKPEKGEYSDKFRAKFGRPYLNKNGEPSFMVYDKAGKEIKWYSDECTSPVEASFNSKRMLAQAIVQCSGLWVIGDKIYCSFKVLVIRTWKPVVNKGFSFVLEDGEKLADGDDEEQEQEGVEESPKKSSEEVKTDVDNFEDDGSDYSEE